MLRWIFGILIFLYLLLCIGCYFLQGKLILWADHIPQDHKYKVGEEVNLKTIDGVTLNNLWVKSKGKPKGLFIYFHGNKGNINRALYQIRVLSNTGYDILITDYRGYGKSDGTLWSDKQMFSDGQMVYDFAKQHYAENQIHILGYSLGTGVSSYLAANNKPRHLFLVAPFTSLTAIKDKYLWFLPDFLLRFQLPNKVHLATVECPVSIVHGTNDEVVDYQFSKELKSIYPDKINLVSSQGQGHRGIIFDNLLREEIMRVVR